MPRPQHYVAYLERSANGDERISMIDAGAEARVIAWRVAHFLNDTRETPERRTFQDFADAMGRDINLELRDVDGRSELGFRIEATAGITIPAASVAEEATYEALCELIPDLADQTPPRINVPGTVECHWLPRTAEGEQKAFYYAPAAKNVRLRGAPIRAALDEGLEARYLKAAPGEIIGTRAVAISYSGGRVNEVHYTKELTLNEDGTFSKQSNPESGDFKLSVFKADDIDDFLAKTFDNGGFCISGRPLIYQDLVARRTKDISKRNYNTATTGSKRSKPLEPGPSIKKTLQEAFPSRRDITRLPITMTTLPSIIELPVKILALDIDKFELSREYDLVEDLDAALEEVRAALPLALQKAEARFMLSTSAGMHEDKPSEKLTFNQKTGIMSCRVWFELDHAMPLPELKEYLCDMPERRIADYMIYSGNQPVYGVPTFVGCEDPLEGKRHAKLAGDRLVDTGLIAAELHAYGRRDERRDEVTHSTTHTNTKLISPTDHASRRNLEHLAGELRGSLEKLSVLGDAPAMAALGAGGHFDLIRKVVNGHLHAVYDDDPLAPPQVIEQQFWLLCSAVTKALIAAVDDPHRVTTGGKFEEYGLSRSGEVDFGGKLAKLIDSAANEIGGQRRRRFDNLTRMVRRGARVDEDRLEEYLATCCLPCKPGIYTERETGAQVAFGNGCLYVEDQTVDEDKRFSWHAQARPDGLLVDLEAKRLKADDLKPVGSIADLFDEDGQQRRDAVFVAGPGAVRVFEQYKKALAEQQVQRGASIRRRATALLAKRSKPVPEPVAESKPAPDQDRKDAVPPVNKARIRPRIRRLPGLGGP